VQLNIAEDKPLLNIINENEEFYLESVITGSKQGNSSPTSKKEEILLDKKQNIPTNLNEHMYLVVRSLKHNNTKIDY
jgi:hypothetical protein